MPLLHRRHGQRQAEKEAKEHSIAENELARGNIKQFHKHEMRAHRAASKSGSAAIAPGTEFGGRPIGGPGVGVGGMGGPCPPFPGQPNMMGGAPYGNPYGANASMQSNLYQQQMGVAMQGGTHIIRGANQSIGLGPAGLEPGYGGPNTPAAAIANTLSPNMHPVATGNGTMMPPGGMGMGMGGGMGSWNQNYAGMSGGQQMMPPGGAPFDKYAQPTRRGLGQRSNSHSGSMYDDDEDYFDDFNGRRGSRGGQGYLPTSYSDNPMMMSRRPYSPSNLMPQSYSMGAMSGRGASPAYDYPTLPDTTRGRSRHVYPEQGGMGRAGVTPVTGTQYWDDDTLMMEGNTLPPQVIVEGPAAPMISSTSMVSTMGLTPTQYTTSTSSTPIMLPPVPLGEEVMSATPLPYMSSSTATAAPAIVVEDGMSMGVTMSEGMEVLPATIVNEAGETIQQGASEDAITAMMLSMPARYASGPSTSSGGQWRQGGQHIAPYVGANVNREVEELEELESKVPALVDRMVTLRERVEPTHERTMMRGTPSPTMMYSDMPGIPRATSSRLAPDLQSVEMAAVRQLQAVDASRVAQLEDELLLLRRRIEDPAGTDTRSELRRLEARAQTLMARRQEDEYEVKRLTELRNQEMAKQRQMKRLAIMIEEQHEQEQRTLADLQRRSFLEEQRLMDLDEDLAFRRTQLRVTDSQTNTTVRRMDDLSKSLSSMNPSGSTLSTLRSIEQNQRPILTPLIVEPDSPTRVPREW